VSTHVNVFQEADLVALLADEPELLAVADAIATTKPLQRRRRAWPALMAASIAVVIGLAAVAVGQRAGSPSLVERALAAVGDGPVVHVVIEEPTENVYVELDSGERTEQLRQIELWIDERRGLEHEVTRIDGHVVNEMLVTPELMASPHPPVYTCAWITAHPAAAKKAGVSCDPKDAHLGYIPQLDPALANFVDGYRSALQKGTAKEIRSGAIDGRPVTWLSLRIEDDRTAEIAVDDDTGKPIRVRERDRTYDVLLLETVGASEGNFRAREQRRPQPVSGRAGAQGPIPLTEASEWVPGALWPGPTVHGLSLSLVELQFPTTGFGSRSGRPVERGVGVELRYGDRSSIVIQQSREPQMAYAWSAYAVPRPGTVLLGFSGGWLVKNGVYVRIWSQNPDVVLDVARALRPIQR
jgi:hypothetical protein